MIDDPAQRRKQRVRLAGNVDRRPEDLPELFRLWGEIENQVFYITQFFQPAATRAKGGWGDAAGGTPEHTEQNMWVRGVVDN